ncbi:hypothetical protein U9M48_029375 [Paspalum notatum var. saurae]|uniref:Integrase catalytic domain-containing protein n=1 Tax=Paspalum notatum var. saurae TaxID=547442 RepID=A0AAQ3TYS7_PASNO
MRPTSEQVCKNMCGPVPLAEPAGLLLPRPFPPLVWAYIGIDFIEALPRVGGKSVILTVVDGFSKYCHFIPPSHPYSAVRGSGILLRHRALARPRPDPSCPTGDPVFTSVLARTDASHGDQTAHDDRLPSSPTDKPKQPTRSSSCTCDALPVTAPDGGPRRLPWAEYVYNTAYRSALRSTPFKIVYGRDPPKDPLL